MAVHEMPPPCLPPADLIVGEVAYGDLLPGPDDPGAVELLVSGVRVVIIITVWVTAVIGPTHPGVQRRLRGADVHGVSLEDAENVTRDIVIICQAHDSGSFICIQAKNTTFYIKCMIP